MTLSMSMSSRNYILGLALATGSLVAAGPCDLYASGGTPCISAHSTTRALYSSYQGPLYQLRRASDGSTINITPLSAGGVADAAAQDTFCQNTTCLITVIYDQSGTGNGLSQAPGGGFFGPEESGYDNLAAASAAPVTLNGQKAYGVFVPPGTGYRNNDAVGAARGDEPEGMYGVLDGTHYNDRCCFDYGNAETSTHDTGNGHMEAIYFGTSGNPVSNRL
ncbi:alpha-L-arabinofuranosidase B [Aspergillus egyptiacus]|nr:alpha-L-arabinofuranosidase B [Aspergillus egyptiacus]